MPLLSLNLDMSDACSPPGQPGYRMQDLSPPLVFQKGALQLCPTHLSPEVRATRILENFIPLMAYCMTLQLCSKVDVP